MQSGDWKGLIQAVLDNEPEEVRYYLSGGVDPNFHHPEMMTSPLIEAVRMDHYEIIELLVAHGANPTSKSQLGESPIQIAKQKKNPQLMKMLKKK